MIIYSRKINTSKEGKYIYYQITLPQELVQNLDWKHGDTLIFNGTTSGIVVITNLSKIKDKHNLEYDKKWLRRLVTKGKSLGFRFSSHSVFDDFRCASNKTIYFTNGKDSIIPNLNIFASFDKQKLDEHVVKERFYSPSDVIDMQREATIKKMGGSFRFYRYKNDVINKNSIWMKRRAIKANQHFNKYRKLSIKSDIERFKQWTKEVSKGNHPKKNEILIYYKERIAELTKEFEKDVKIFTEFEVYKKKLGYHKNKSSRKASTTTQSKKVTPKKDNKGNSPARIRTEVPRPKISDD